MTSLEYYRPQTLDEALKLLEQGVPLAGGTQLTPRLRGIGALVDLQDLALDQIEVTESTLEFGGTATLQGLVDNASRLPDALIQAARLEAGWNIRNKATIAGTIVTGDGRSPLLTVLLALGADLEFAPGGERISLADALDQGADRTGGKLIAAIHAVNPSRMKYAQVARSPADRPQICVAVAVFDSEAPVRIALGGHGAYPQLLSKDESLSTQGAAELAGTMYAEAGDQWASADYRSSVAATLVARLLTEVETE
jgi:CO/xanthine dehydrogenase FAD-binding subunit